MKLLQGIHIGLTLLLLGLVVLIIVRLKPLDAVVTEHSPQALTNGRKSTERPHAVKGRLLVLRGAKPGWQFPLYEGPNVLGRSEEKPADIDLMELEAAPDRIWSSFQHAAITCEGDNVAIEDLNSANGTYVNRERVPPGKRRRLQVNDIVQIGEIQLRVLLP